MWTQTGLQAIETIRRGSQVLARDLLTGRQEYKEVTDTHVSHPAQLYRVRYQALPAAGTVAAAAGVSVLAPGWQAPGANHPPERADHTNNLAPPPVSAPAPAEVLCTGEHPFFAVTKQAFVAASQLAAGERLLLADGQQAQVVADSGWVEEPPAGAAAAQALTTYNLEVADFHTYFVGAEGVWVHNLCSAGVEKYASLFEQLLKQAGGDFDKAAQELLAAMRQQPGLSDPDYSAVSEYVTLREANQ